MASGCLPKLRIAGILTVGIALALFAISLSLFAVIRLILPAVAWVLPSLGTLFYDLGTYGAHPTRDYVSFNLTSPLFSHLLWDDQCDSGLILLTPRGAALDYMGPLIVDPMGELIWTSDQYDEVTNLKVQEYRGQKFLTFWSGEQSTTFGAGIYHMLDSSYRSVYQVKAVGEGLHGDLHEFRLTKDGTALITVYNVTTMDLTSMGRPVEGWIIDSIFQEIDIKTGGLVFQWKASEHFNSTDSYASNPFAGYRKGIPFDFFHINSIEKDSAGNFLISSRHTHTVTLVNGKTGNIMWVLGGEKNEFTDIDGKAVTYTWQHDASWVSEDESILTLFNNGDAGPLHIDAPYSRGLMLKLDVANRTVQFLHEYISLQKTRTPSQGSLQILPESNNVFIGWGHSAAFSEFKTDGTLVCESHFGASWYYWWGRIVSYRSWKTKEWTAEPEYPPTATIQGSHLYVSWNGATEVAIWELQGAAAEEKQFEEVDITEKVGFEGIFSLPVNNYYKYYRVAAKDKNGKVLRYSNVTQKEPGWTVISFLLTSVVCGGVVFGIRIMYSLWKAKSRTDTVWWKSEGSNLCEHGYNLLWRRKGGMPRGSCLPYIQHYVHVDVDHMEVT